jgi:hypothetical protein
VAAAQRGFLIQRRDGAAAGGATGGTTGASLTGGLRSVGGDVLRIGRGTNAELRFDDPAVALEHARIERRGEGAEAGVFVVDLGSVTGTYVGGEAVRETRLGDGDVVGVGGHRLRVRFQGTGSGAAADLVVVTVEAVEEVAQDAAPPPDAGTPAARGRGTPVGPVVEAAPVDYVRAYRLRRPLLSKTSLAVLLLAAVLAALAWVVVSGTTPAFRPGSLAAAHQREISAWNCAACHRPWRGAADALCGDCHGANQIVHQAAQVRTPGCTGCHLEHQGKERIQVVTDGDCTVCHAALEVAPGATPRFATEIPSFAAHPELAVTTADGRRLRLDTEEARHADATALLLNHAKHLAPNLLSPEAPGGRETLDCRSCHQLALNEPGSAVAGAFEDLVPVSYELHCARCHRLDFDPAHAPAPHEPPATLHNYVRGVYLNEGQAVQSLLETRQRAVQNLPRSRASQRSLEQRATNAEYDLYRLRCTLCHQIDLKATPLPLVTPPAVPTDWLPYSHFSHATHVPLDAALNPERPCVGCHPSAATSTATADVLLPSMSVCQPCHGETAASREQRARSRCIDCHSYHPQTRRKRAAATAG